VQGDEGKAAALRQLAIGAVQLALPICPDPETRGISACPWCEPVKGNDQQGPRIDAPGFFHLHLDTDHPGPANIRSIPTP